MRYDALRALNSVDRDRYVLEFSSRFWAVTNDLLDRGATGCAAAFGDLRGRCSRRAEQQCQRGNRPI